MADIVVRNGIVVTMNGDREVIDDGAVVVEDDVIVAVGPTSELEVDYDAAHVVDASDHAVLPGLVNAHTHVSDILVRGGVGSNRGLYDWIFNVKFPGVGAMTPEEHGVASALYSSEAIKSGITTFVENAVGTGGGYSRDVAEAKFDAYEAAGMRNVFAQSFIDVDQEEAFRKYTETLMSKAPDVEHHPYEENVVDTETGLETIRSMIEAYHGRANGRQSVWPGPLLPSTTSSDGFRGAYRIAEEYDVMTTTHIAETRQHEGGYQSSVEYLSNVGYLGDRALFGHCVHLSDHDIQLLAQTDTRVAHNPLTNQALGAGVAPVPEMIKNGVTVGLGTDNTSASDTVNAINDMRHAALMHKAYREEPASITAEKVLEMVTIDGARAIGREDELGSIESGKKADIVLIDLDHDHLIPRRSVPSLIVYQAQGFEVDTVVCNGDLIMDDRNVLGLAEEYPDLREQAQAASDAVLERTGIETLLDRPWEAISSL